MKYDVYPAIAGDEYNTFEFTSVGPRGNILKRVLFAATEYPEVFNLAFGDVHSNRVDVSDNIITDNGDRNKTLSTIAKIIDTYTSVYPNRWVYLRGSTPARTRLYQMAIGLNYKELNKTYMTYGFLDEEKLEPFEKGKTFLAFLIKKKN